MPKNLPELAPLTYTVPQAAAALNVSDDTVRAMVKREEIPSLRIGRRTLIVRTVLDRWVQEHTNAHVAAIVEQGSAA